MAQVDKNKVADPGDALVAAQTLRRRGWPSEMIDKILSGPERSSIHDIAGRPINAWPVSTVDAVVVPDDADATSTPLAKENASQSNAGIGQKQIADAVWASVSAGDPIPLASIARQIKKLPKPLQAYLLAASLDVKRFYKDLTEWKRDFDRAQKVKDSQRKQSRKEGEALAQTAAGVVTAVATAAAAANAVPIVGQAVSAALAIGLAVAVAVTEANPLPVRKSEDQVRPGYEGVSIFWGFCAEPPEAPAENTYLKLKQAVVLDDVAFSLPRVPLKTPFDFAPRLAAFQEAAHQLGLYPEDGTPT